MYNGCSDSNSPEFKAQDPELMKNGFLSFCREGLKGFYEGVTDKKYATALIKLQWGNNLSKFAGIQMPGGVTLDGVRIMTEAREEIEKLEEEMQIINVLPGEIMMG